MSGLRHQILRARVYISWRRTNKSNAWSVCSIAGGELFERIVDDNFEHTESASVRYMQEILEGVAYMHQQNIVHLDLKPENIVCVDPISTSIKIIDFGLACKLGENLRCSIVFIHCPV